MVHPDSAGYFLARSGNDTWIKLARILADLSNCQRRKVGALVVTTDNIPIIAGSGYNQDAMRLGRECASQCPRGRLSYEECPEGGDYDNCFAIHAEAAAIIQAGSRARNAILYCTETPCKGCQKLIHYAGIGHVYTPEGKFL